ncbi:MAG: hypothetical protein SVY41_00185 [Candidatus Nanohaloarchaea archaeon]|nr:hypothetical protein [Candidatus Nanohaloarchaea archaeon]
MWSSSSKPDRADHDEPSVGYIAFLGFVGLLLEVIGVWLVFSWVSTTPQALGDPKLLVGGVLAVVGFLVLTRWLASVVKALVR